MRDGETGGSPGAVDETCPPIRNAFPYEQQVQAKQLAEQGDYAEATALPDTLGDYAGSAALAKEYRYQQAQAEAASEITMLRLPSTRNLRVMRTATRFAAQAAMKRQ